MSQVQNIRRPSLRQSGKEAARSDSIDEARIVTALEANVIEADTIQGNEVSEQRIRNHVYYAIEKVGGEKKNRSHHVSADVFDSVESQKAYYQEAFSGNRRPVVFQPEDEQDKLARLATEYVTDQFKSKNKGFAFIRDSLHDAMVAKRCVAKVEWRSDVITKTEQFDNLTQAQLLQLQQRPDIVSIDPTKTDSGPNGVKVFSGTLDREEDVGFNEVELVQPERYYRDPNVSFVEEANFAGFQEDLSRRDLMDQGFDEEEVMALRLDYRFRQNEEETARKSHDQSWSRARRSKREPEMELITVYWHWGYFDLSNFRKGGGVAPGIGDVRLYKFVWSQGALLTLPETMEFDEDGTMIDSRRFIEEKDGMPFKEWTQYKISHAEFGLCEADVQYDLQRTKSNLRRLIIDNQAMGNTSRWKARHGFIKNPRELLDNNIGSVLWLKDMKALEPLITPPISNASFNLLETLDVEKENRSGLSRLAKGLSGDAISHQNAADMIQRLTNASNRRVLRGVRDYAETFLSEIFLRIYTLGVRHDKSTHHVEINGQWIPLTPQKWPMRTKAKVTVALTPDEGREKGMFLMQAHGMMSQDEELKKLYGVSQKHAMMNDIFELMDAGDASRYMMHPASEEYKQQLQREQQMQEMAQQMQKFEVWLEKTGMQLKIQEQKRKDGDTATDNLLEEDKFEHEKLMDFIDAGLEITQRRPAKIGN